MTRFWRWFYASWLYRRWDAIAGTPRSCWFGHLWGRAAFDWRTDDGPWPGRVWATRRCQLCGFERSRRAGVTW